MRRATAFPTSAARWRWRAPTPPNSATSQFFIDTVENGPKLDRGKTQDGVGYAVFGKVIDGMDIVDKISDVKTAERGPHENVPVEDVIIKSIRRAPQKEETPKK